MSSKYELKPSDLRYLFDPQVFKFKNTSSVRPLDEVIGQTRAVQAIEFGLNMDSPGYNIFVTGIEGKPESRGPANRPSYKTSSANMPKRCHPAATGAWSTTLAMNFALKPFRYPPVRP
jgi:hypothetical protein